MMYGVLIIAAIIACWLVLQNKPGARDAAQSYLQEDAPALSAEQIQLITESWACVVPIKEQAAEMFYARLFELDPNVKPLFKGKLDYQGDKLMTTLNVIVNSLDNLTEVEGMLQAMGKRHIIYKVEAAHYETVGAALIWVLEQGLGDSFTAEVREAWVIAYGLIAETMKQAAYH